MSLTINDFRGAVEQLGENATLRLKEDGSGIATSQWERFKVGFCDLFRSAESISAKRTEAMQAFREAVKAEYSGELYDILENDLPIVGTRLSARMVRDTIGVMEARGGQNWLNNEQQIRQAAHCTAPLHPGMLSLTDIVNPVFDKLMQKAQEKGMPFDAVREMSLKFTIEASQLGKNNFDMPDVSHAIEEALRCASIRQDGGGYVRLEPDKVKGIAQDTAERVIREKINRYFYGEYEKTYPSFASDFRERAKKEGLENRLPHMNIPLANELEWFERDDAKEILSGDDFDTVREKVLDRYFGRQREKLEQIGQLDLLEGKAKDDVVKICMGTRSRMDANYFAHVESASKLFETFATELAKHGGEDPNHLITFIKDKMAIPLVHEHFPGAKTEAMDDVVQFMKLAFDVFAARHPDQVEAVKNWADSHEETFFDQVNLGQMDQEMRMRDFSSMEVFGALKEAGRLIDKNNGSAKQ